MSTTQNWPVAGKEFAADDADNFVLTSADICVICGEIIDRDTNREFVACVRQLLTLVGPCSPVAENPRQSRGLGGVMVS
jgi:hypothetical protein